MTEQNQELTQEQQDDFDRSGNHPFTANGIRKNIGAPHDPNPNATVRRLIGAENASAIARSLEQGRVERAEREAREEAERDQRLGQQVLEILKETDPNPKS